MRVRWGCAALLSIWCLCCAASAAQPATTPEPRETFSVGAAPWRHDLRYRLLLPDVFDAATAYPVVLMLPPGKQDEPMVDAAIASYVGREHAKRGWVVACPIAAEGMNWSEIPAEEFDRLLLDIAARVRVEGGKFIFAGVSAGGRSAAKLALELPERCGGVLLLPGYFEPEVKIPSPPPATLKVFVGDRDEQWKPRAQATAEAWREAGGKAEVEVLKGEEHVLRALSPAKVFTTLEALRADARVDGEEEEARAKRGAEGNAAPQDVPGMLRAEAEVAGLLDRLHTAAADADERTYFGCFALDAVFLGTDPTERWTVDEFRKKASASFSDHKGWRFEPNEREVHVHVGLAVAWFDETLRHERYGTLRGVGVAVRQAEGWRVAQYALSVPIPNAQLLDVLEFMER